MSNITTFEWSPGGQGNFQLKDDPSTQFSLFFDFKRDNIKGSSMGLVIKAFKNKCPLNINLYLKDSNRCIIKEFFVFNYMFEHIDQAWAIPLSKIPDLNDLVDMSYSQSGTMSYSPFGTMSSTTSYSQRRGFICCKIKRSLFAYCKTKPDSLFRNKLWQQYQQGLEADITIKCGEQEFKVGRFILTSQCEYFEKMFSTNMKEAKSKTLEIKDVPAPVVEAFIYWLYLGRIEKTELVTDLFLLAHCYMIEELKNQCVDLIANSLNQENAVEWFKFSAIHQSSRLRDYVLDFLELHESVNKLRKFGEGIWPKMCGK